MCLIVLKRDDSETFSYEDFVAAVDNNPHGTGIMYPKDGRIIHRKLGKPSYQENKDMYKEFISQPRSALHVRIKTHGETNDVNAHPFKVLDKDKDGLDLYMMHNGRVPTSEIDKAMSDTWHFVNFVLRPIVKKTPYTLVNPITQKMIKGMIGSSRLVFMYGDGTYVTIDDGSADTSYKDGGVWLSNKHSLYKRNYNTNSSNVYKPSSNNNNKSSNYTSYCGYGDDDADDGDYLHDRPKQVGGTDLPLLEQDKKDKGSGEDQSWSPRTVNKKPEDMTYKELSDASFQEEIYLEDGWWSDGLYYSYQTMEPQDLAGINKKEQTVSEYLAENMNKGVVDGNIAKDSPKEEKPLGEKPTTRQRQSFQDLFTSESSLDDVLDALVDINPVDVENMVFDQPHETASLLNLIKDLYYHEWYDVDDSEENEVAEEDVPFAQVD